MLTANIFPGKGGGRVARVHSWDCSTESREARLFCSSGGLRLFQDSLFIFRSLSELLLQRGILFFIFHLLIRALAGFCFLIDSTVE